MSKVCLNLILICLTKLTGLHFSTIFVKFKKIKKFSSFHNFPLQKQKTKPFNDGKLSDLSDGYQVPTVAGFHNTKQNTKAFHSRPL